jgi:hypothetical protein
MRTNPHTGTVTIETGGGAVRLRYDWEAISELHGLYGKEWEVEVSRILSEFDSNEIAKILALGSDQDAEWWMTQSPPFLPVAGAIQEALRLAFFGAEEPEKNPHLARRLMTRFAKVLGSGQNSAGVQQISGG